MPQIINTNIASLNSQRNLNSSQMSLQTSLARLSSGLRINSARDDAAGLAIADRFSTQIRGVNQAARNANDGISLAQTAEGALNEVSNNLQRIRELAVQSANGTNTTIDRQALNDEVSQLLAEIDRISTTTQFNGRSLLDGSFTSQQFQVGSNANQTISVSVNAAKTSTLGTGDASSVTSSPSVAAALAEGDLVINGVTIGASVGSADTASTTDASFSSIAKAAAINAKSSSTGVSATVNETVAAGVNMTAAALTGTITINGVTTGSISTTTDAAISRSAVVAGINAISGQTGVKAVDTGQDTSGVNLVAADGRNITVAFGGAGPLTSAATGVIAAGTQYGTFSLSSTKDIVVAQGTGTLSNSGLKAGTYTPQVAYASTSSGTSTALASGDVKINGILVGASLATYDSYSSTDKATSAISKAYAVNLVSSQTGVTAKVNTNIVSGVSMTAPAAALTGTLTINGVATSSITTTTNATPSTNADTRALVVTAINAISGQTGVVAINTNSDTNGVRLEAADGRNITIGYTGSLTSAATGVATAATRYGTFMLTSASTYTVAKGTGTAGTTNFGLGIGTYGATKTGKALSGISVETVDGANQAITAVDNALASINSSRSNLGAIQNRFAATVTSLQATSENLTAARSRIQDADFAAETASLTRNQVLQQAGIAILAQANALPQQVLSLLR